MESLGDLQRAFFDGIYTFRLPLAILSVAVVALGVTVAWRLGWFASARRHPRLSSIAIIVGLTIALPMGYYLASPIWIRTVLIEPDPIVDVVVRVSSAPVASSAESPSTDPSRASTDVPYASPTLSPFRPRTIAVGSFHGTDDFHFGRGTARIVEAEPGTYTLQLADFSVRNGPDLYVYLSPDRNGYASGALELGRLKATDGAFGYALPDGVEPTDFASAIIWCKQFSHLFAVASLNAG